ncbi:glycolipid 2-alpha-mannosyltransferase-domain-containing protein [Mycena olivaceomarginata]|nr:glycolipid 2-alpha-mannosyltransferase-domain-containing protein [Mycena olivaceomarginata]
MPPTCTHHDALPIDVDNGGGSKEVLTNLALPASNNLLSISSVLLTTSNSACSPLLTRCAVLSCCSAPHARLPFHAHHKLLVCAFYLHPCECLRRVSIRRPDVKFHCTLPFDPFQYMAMQGKVYTFTIALYEWSATIPTLWDTVKDFMKQNPDVVALDNTMGFLSENGGQDFNMCHWEGYGGLDEYREEPFAVPTSCIAGPLSSSAWTFSASSSPPSCYPFASISPLPLFFPFPVIATPLHPPFPAMPPRSSLLPSSASHSLPTHPPRPSLPPTLPSSYSSPLPPRSLANLLTPHPPVWSNFEITDLNFWRGLVYTKLFEFLDKTGGFYYEKLTSSPQITRPNHVPTLLHLRVHVRLIILLHVLLLPISFPPLLTTTPTPTCT